MGYPTIAHAIADAVRRSRPRPRWTFPSQGIPIKRVYVYLRISGEIILTRKQIEEPMTLLIHVATVHSGKIVYQDKDLP